VVSGNVPLELCLVTASVDLAKRAEATGIERVLVDLETIGKAERQAGQNLFHSTHTLDDAYRLRSVLRDTKLMVRTNPIHDGSPGEIRDVLSAGADVLMLAMTRSADDAVRFVELVDGRASVSILIENSAALECLPTIVRVSGVSEIHVGLNDLRLSLGFTLLFEPLLEGHVDQAAGVVHDAGLRFGFGGVASPLAENLPIRAERIIGEHVGLGSSLAWLGRSFRHRVDGAESGDKMRQDVDAIRACARDWSSRSPAEFDANREAIARDVEEWRQARSSTMASA
jgi:HpcH/HpaI aldolase/citrate lyase family